MEVFDMRSVFFLILTALAVSGCEEAVQETENVSRGILGLLVTENMQPNLLGLALVYVIGLAALKVMFEKEEQKANWKLIAGLSTIFPVLTVALGYMFGIYA